jgi:hypothetical protein
VSEFVDECRQEWRRLGVPDAVANEMAADLTADLREAESEGVSAEEVLGSGAFDPRSFAVDWATERGVVSVTAPVVVDEQRPVPDTNSSKRTVLVAAVAALAVIAFIGAALVTRNTGSVAVARAFKPALPLPDIRHRILPVFPLPNHDGFRHGIGALLLLVAIAGLIGAALYWSRRIRPNH